MQRGVHVPLSLLRTRDLTPAAKVVWMAALLEAHQERDHISVAPRLADLTGLARSTIQSALKQFKTAQWHLGWQVSSSASGTHVRRSDNDTQTTVFIPIELLTDHTVGVGARILYGMLQTTPAYRNRQGQVTYTSLRRLTCMNRRTLKRALGELIQTGWTEISRANRLAPVHFSLCNPIMTQTEALVAMVKRRLKRAQFVGEALMREYLSLLIESDNFADDASPGFLVNPLTSERMELDRFYPNHVAFEFNGPQHYGATDQFSAETATAQRARDLMKLGICVSRGITLVIVHPEDLMLRTMQEKVGNLLPLRDLHDHAPVINYLESVSRAYRRAARRGRG